MKKLLMMLGVFVVCIAGGGYYFLSGADELIRTQIEKQGSKFMATPVAVANVELVITEGRLTIEGIDVSNPQGFSDASAFNLGAMTLDLGKITSEPYTVQTVSVDAPVILYEVNADGESNLIVLKDKLTANLPKSDTPPVEEPSNEGANPLVIVENVTVSNTRLILNLVKLPTGELDLGDKTFEITLPTFNADAIGKPNGMPADQVGGAIVNAMLSNVIEQAKVEVQNRIKQLAKDKAKEKLNQEKDKLKDKLKDKAKNKLKDIFGAG